MKFYDMPDWKGLAGARAVELKMVAAPAGDVAVEVPTATADRKQGRANALRVMPLQTTTAEV